MRCCDCEFRKDCSQVESDIVSFTLCGTRIGKLAVIEKEKLLARLNQPDSTEVKA